MRDPNRRFHMHPWALGALYRAGGAKGPAMTEPDDMSEAEEIRREKFPRHRLAPEAGGQSSLPCPACPRIWSREQTLAAHLADVHGVPIIEAVEQARGLAAAAKASRMARSRRWV